jgi:hypothetical protein
MNDKTLQLLKMVAQGQVSPEDAAALFASANRSAPAAAVDRLAPSPNLQVAATPPAKPRRHDPLGLIAFIAAGLGFMLFPLFGLAACFMLGSLSPHHLSWFHYIAATSPILTPLLIVLVIIPGILAWKKFSGKLAAIGGLTAATVPILLAICLLLSNSSK